MALERRYIEEVGEAVEALGIMLERELGAISQGLGELYRIVARIKEEEGSLGEEIQVLKEQMTRTQNLLQGFEAIVSRVESKLMDLQKDFDEEGYAEEIKNDLLVVKRDLQIARSDLKELLNRQDNIGNMSKHRQERKEEFEGQ